MIKRLLYGFACLVIGAALGWLVGMKPSVLGSNLCAFIGGAVGFVTGFGAEEGCVRRFLPGFGGAMIGIAIGFILGELSPAVGGRLGMFVGAWIGFAAGTGYKT